MLFTLLAALVVFCAVQDRITAAGARRYVALQRDALAGGRPPVTIAEVMEPAVDASVTYGALSAGAVLIAGWFVSSLVGRRDR
jgi:hypothetical protein